MLKCQHLSSVKAYCINLLALKIDQIHDFIRVHYQHTYQTLFKIKLLISQITQNKQTPMASDNDLIKQLDTSVGPLNDADKLALQEEMGFICRNATGKLLFAMVTYRPDISNAVIRLTQLNVNPA